MKKIFLIAGLVALIMSGCDILEEKPRAPLWVLATPYSDSSIKVTWEDVKNAESYEVYFEKAENSDGTKKIIDTAETSYLHEGLEQEAYKYLIKSKNSNGVSSYSFESIPMKPWGTTAGSSPNSPTEITSSGVDGTLSSLLSTELWFTFTGNGQGTLSAKDKDNDSNYTADIVVDIYTAPPPNPVFATVNGQHANRLNLGATGLGSITQTWTGKYYVRVYSYSILTVGTFQLSFN